MAEEGGADDHGFCLLLWGPQPGHPGHPLSCSALCSSTFVLGSSQELPQEVLTAGRWGGCHASLKREKLSDGGVSGQ